ncbi:LysR substrate-binding domain-containing protein [Microvirga pudoricolor]|uniref:LysR substrate-binding domain-containing protein n=1 Tax=Microvirga pudoricolor TaxID=2778729 RepID=UPI00194DEDA1|nr:LysR substrate-binding domain-containing protein [Microvirga pudoricolor]MBM6593659.1 LysR family transcriptional regulator [Microvirga pudoricolor]
MRRRLLPLSALRAFEAAGRHESFQKAAEELGVTTSAVSRQVAELERVLGGKLFSRSVRKVDLTEEGLQLQTSLSDVFDDMTIALRAARERLKQRPAAAQALTIHVLPTFATRILFPRLPAFEEAHPDLPVSLTVATGQGTSRRQNPDVVIDYSPVAPDDAGSILFQEDALPVCAPHYIGGADWGRTLTPDDLLKGRLLSATDDCWDWKMWAAFQRLRWPAQVRLMQFETDDLTIQAALAGTGIALVERRFILNELDSQRLVPVGRQATAPLGYYFLRMPGGHATGPAKAFSDWLRSVVRDLDAPRDGR